MRAASLVVFFSVCALADDLPRFELVTSVQGPDDSMPTVYWSKDRLCVPAGALGEGFTCHDVGPGARRSPVREKAAASQEVEEGKAVPFSWSGRKLALDTSSGTVATAGPSLGEARFSSITSLACPGAGLRARGFALIRGPKPTQLAVLRLDAYNHGPSPCDGHDVACPGPMQTWSVLVATRSCDSPDGGL